MAVGSSPTRPTFGMFGAGAPSPCPCLLWGATPHTPTVRLVPDPAWFRWARPLADGLYNIGAAFTQQFDFDKPPPPSPTKAADSDPDAELKRIRQSILD